jgi:tetratricopeptide (TPR) repeat protein
MRASVAWLSVGLFIATPALADDLDSLASAVDAQPNDPMTYDTYALAAIRERRFDEAIRRLKVGVARIGEYHEGYYKLAYLYRRKREWADAAGYYRCYLALEPSTTDAYFGLGAALEGLGDRKGAITAYETYASLERAPEKQRFVDQAKTELIKLRRLSPPAAPDPTQNASAPSEH